MQANLCMTCCWPDSTRITRHSLSKAYNGLQEDDTSQQAAPGLNLPEADAPNPRGILVLVSQPPYCLTVEEASKLTIPAFSALWTVSLHIPAMMILCLLSYGSVLHPTFMIACHLIIQHPVCP